ncbi:MAG: hypothetical protein IJ815_06285 [Lachnospiraceae bacterium]|nr:hypothetical protein [Lachnospiraceae bacterium]MCR5776546.1 hypothetical protein [Lachnospiraceae bacterium]
MRKEMDYDSWLDWFIIDHKLNIQEILIEEILDGQPYKIKMVDFLNKTRTMNSIVQHEIRGQMLKCTYTNKSVSKYLQDICRKFITDGKILL